MASDQDPADTTTEAATGADAPVKAPRKRASRRVTTTAAPVDTPDAVAGDTSNASVATSGAQPAAAAREAAEAAAVTPRKRASRKRAAVALASLPAVANDDSPLAGDGAGAPSSDAASLQSVDEAGLSVHAPAPRKRATRRQTTSVGAPDSPAAEGAPADTVQADSATVSTATAVPGGAGPAGEDGSRDSTAAVPSEAAPARARAPRRGRRAASVTADPTSPQAAAPASDATPASSAPALDSLDESRPISDLLVTELSDAETEELLAEGAALAAEAAAAPVQPVNTFGLLFQAPDPAAAPALRRRRATAPAGAPDEGLAITVEATADEPTVVEEAPEQDAETDEDAGRRRRRRGGKGRRRPGADEEPEGESAVEETPAAEADPQVDADDEPGGAGRRRTRRRRRSGSAGESEDPPGTVTRVREARRDRDEATGIKGSTRLEAKKQRRREGREAGRRRTIITEAEFLARRESVERVMVVRQHDERTQIGVLEDGVLVEHYVSAVDSGQSGSMAGNVYWGRVQNVLPSMEAAFVDIGRGRNAVLYAGEVNWDAAGLEAHKSRRIENALSSGQGVLVQVTKDPIGHKGARLTSQISLPGRYLVYVPQGRMTGISRKLPENERARLKKILKDVVPADAGVIVRTAAEGASEAELRADVERLANIWETIQRKAGSANPPALLHGEVDLTVRVIRDVFNEDFASMIVAGDEAWATVNDYIGFVAPDLAPRLRKWTGSGDVFAEHRIDEQLAKAMGRKVWLPSGGSLVIDRTEAMTVIDVNTGKFVGAGGNLEETVTKNNIEAAEEIVRQLRLRDIGGIIVIDFIDMVLESNRDLVVRRLLECLGRDRTKHQVAEVTSLGLVQMTRKRVGAGLIEVFSEPCEHCNGRGIIVSDTPVNDPSGSGGGGNGGHSGGGNGGHAGSGNNGGGNSSGNEGGRRRRGRGGSNAGGGQAASAPAVVERPVPSGPTPAQIAAAAYAALHPEKRAEAQPGDAEGGEESRSAEVADVTPSGDIVPTTQVVGADSDDRAERAYAEAVVAAAEATPATATGEAAPASAPRKTGRVRRGASRPVATPGDAGSDAAAATTAPASPAESTGPAIGWPAEGGSTQPDGEVGWPGSGSARRPAEPVAGAAAQADRSAAAEADPAGEPPQRPRRRRGRVVAPAGPPRGSEESRPEAGGGQEDLGR